MTPTTRPCLNPLRFTLLLTAIVAGCGGGGGGPYFPGGGAKDGGNCDAMPASCGGCAYDFECRAPTPRCDTAAHKCAACLPTNDNCPAGQHCVDVNGAWTCTATCKMAADCKGGGAPECCGSLCVDTQVDAKNCGACGKSCAAVMNGASACAAGSCAIGACDKGFADCDKRVETGCETQTASDPSNCGACGNLCRLTNATAACAQGACAIQSCAMGFADCDQKPGNGCEAGTSSDVANCGGCGRACGNVPNAASECRNGACAVGPCSNGYANCDGIVANGCEVGTDADPRNCGGCAVVCNLPNATAGCQGGRCAVTKCANGFSDCDAIALNGCESNVTMDTQNCGACGNACPAYANATSVCNNGNCAIGACDAGFANCDASAANGCEVDLDNDAKNCGSCGRACAINQTCRSGACVQNTSKVLVAGAVSTAGWLTDIQTKLQATGAFSQVTTYNLNTSTPTVATLQQYDAVLVFSDASFSNATTLGDNLATYYDGGGQVVVAVFANASVTIGGRFGTVGNGYMLLNPTGQESPNDSLGQIVEPQSPLMTGVTRLSATAAYKSVGAVANGGIVVARWTGGKPLVVRGVVKGRNRADLNFYPPSSTVRADFWTGDGAILMKNALLYR